MDKNGPVWPAAEVDGADTREASEETFGFDPWQNLWERISEADLDDRMKWSKPINDDPMEYFLELLNR